MESVSSIVDLSTLWTRVMREGAAIEDVAYELHMPVSQLEQLLMQAGRARLKGDELQQKPADHP
jgi:hypothetical protein